MFFCDCTHAVLRISNSFYFQIVVYARVTVNFFHLLVDGRLGLFPASDNYKQSCGKYLYGHMPSFILGEIPSGRIAEPYVNYVFNVMRN